MLHIPSNSKVSGKAQEVLEHCHDDICILAAEAMVHDVAATQWGKSNTSCSNPEPSFLGAVSAPNSGEPAPDGLETERQRFIGSGCSN